MNWFKPFLGLGFLAGAAFLAVKLVELFDRTQDVEWTAVMGEMPEEEYTVPAPERTAEPEPAEPSVEKAAPAEKRAPDEPAGGEPEPAQAPDADAGRVPPREAEQTFAERVTVHPRRARIDPTTIARAEDFQDWEDFGCRG